MASNNLRIVYRNVVDLPTTTLTPQFTTNATSYPIGNLKLDTKSATWKADSSNVTNILVSVGTLTDKINSIILLNSNLSSSATIRVLQYSSAPTFGGTTGTPTITPAATANSGAITCIPYPTNVNTGEWAAFAYNTNTYGLDKNTARIWFTPPATIYPYIVIQISDAEQSNIEFSRLIMGTYWSPVYNTGYGVSKGISDNSTNERTEAGDLITTTGSVFSTMSFDLQWMTNADRVEMLKVLKFNGKRRGMFISVFPENTADFAKEKDFQIYGKLSSTSAISHPVLDMYSTSIEIEEI